jgi:hypothetical protein
VAAELLLIDLLTQADMEFEMLLSTQIDDENGLPVHPHYESFQYQKMPISRAWSEYLSCFYGLLS